MKLKQKQVHLFGWVITGGMATVAHTHDIDFKVHTGAGMAQLALGTWWFIVNWGRAGK